LEAAFEAKQAHKSQPLQHLLWSAYNQCLTNEPPSFASGALGVTNRAIEQIHRAARDYRDGHLEKWLDDRMRRAADSVDFANAASSLGEIRALGDLVTVAGRYFPGRVGAIGESKERATPDFAVSHLEGQEFVVEVATKQMEGNEAEQLQAFYEEPLTPFAKGIAINSKSVAPAGAPAPGENTPENVASKLAQVKPRARQASEEVPSLLWIDFMDQDWWMAMRAPSSAAHCEFTPQHSLFCTGVWQAFYGSPGTLLPQNAELGQRLWLRTVRMKHPGLFEQSPKWSAVVLAFLDGYVLFENPDPVVRFSRHSIRALLSGLNADLVHSRVSLSEQNSEDLRDRIRWERDFFEFLLGAAECRDDLAEQD
jgi:hypothetical protein